MARVTFYQESEQFEGRLGEMGKARNTARTPRGYVRLHRVNASPGNLGFTIPIALSRRMESAGQHEGDLYRAVLTVDGVGFVRIPDHAAPIEKEAPSDFPKSDSGDYV